MTDWERSLATCALQIMVMTAIALGLLAALRRRTNMDRLALCRWAYIGLLLLCFQAAVRPWMSDWSVWQPTTNSVVAGPVTQPGSHFVETIATVDPPGVTIPWSAWRASGRRLWKAMGADVVQSTWPEWRIFLLVPMAGLMLVAGLRFGLSLWWTHDLWRSSIPIGDEALCAELTALQQQYGLRVRIAVRETSALSQAAVIGWWQPVILLPVTFRDWSAEERRLVLAHELAHVKEGDFRWRVLAEIVRVLHAYQPLIYGLHHRLILEQELAADRAAAALCGGTAVYLRTLSRLALRSDFRSERTTFAPVLTGLLFRRIEMLQTKDGRTVSARHGWNGWIRAGFVAALALVSGLHLPAGAEGPPAADTPNRVVAGTDEASPPRMPAGIFARRIQEPLFVPQSTGGILELHLNEFLSGPASIVLTRKLYREFLDEMTEDIESMIGNDAKGLVTMVCEYGLFGTVATDISLQLEHHPDRQDGERNQMTFSAQSLRCRVDGIEPWNWKSELEADPDRLRRFRDIPYWSIPTPMAGPSKAPVHLLWATDPDPKTLVLVFGEEALPNAFPEQPKALPANQLRLRQSVGGGVLTLVLPKTALKVKGLDNSADPHDLMLGKLAAQFDAVALGIDIAPDNQLAIRLRGNCSSLTEARAAETALQSLFETARSSLAEIKIIKTNGNEKQEVDGGVTFLREVLAHIQLRMEAQPDGTTDVVLDTFGSRWFELQ